MRSISLLLIALFISAVGLNATIITVNWDGSGDYITIQEGINAAIDGDTVLVYPGNYIENIHIYSKNIIVGSLILTTGDTTYISQTVIDGNQNGSVVTFEGVEDDTAILCGFTITNGTGTQTGLGGLIRLGGGILCRFGSNITLKDLIVIGNTADVDGGIGCCNDSNMYLSNVTITNNWAFYGGGGIGCVDNSYINFDPNNRCNIYCNNAGCGSDLASDSNVTLIVDTFSVLQPNEYHVSPIENFSFDICHGKIEQVESDLYVSPAGNNNNSGISSLSPLRNINFALSKIIADSLHPHSIYLDTGTYSLSDNYEIFPLNCRSYVSIIGEGEDLTILNGEYNQSILYCVDDVNFSVENITIENGVALYGGGVSCVNNSNPVLFNVTIKNNCACYGDGGGIYCNNSNPSLINATIMDNYSNLGGGSISCNNSNPSLSNVIITDNSAYYGGGISCDDNSNPHLNTVIITGNSAFWDGGGICCGDNSCPSFINVTIGNNSAGYNGGGIYCWYSSPSLINCIVSGNSGNYGIYNNPNNPDQPIITYSDFWNNEGGNFYNCGSNVGVNVTLNANGDSCDVYYNIQLDPLFADTTSSDFHLTEYSPCIDAGNPDTTGLNLPPFDLDGNPRIYNGIVDMGCYEWQGVAVDDTIHTYHTLTLHQNFPNPFKSSTQISFSLPNPEKVKIQIYNLKGQLAETLLDENKPAGSHTLVWNAENASSGIYFMKLLTKEKAVVRKLVIIK
ncbi:MAG: T9SS type A sorting domain-containing protein [Candidatus Cloacimonetes bacterium]|nr:T9SS type A sorting domain-containing protein [Candidatus Cloacimonadota bacterium]